jgi:hypothetical protein
MLVIISHVCGHFSVGSKAATHRSIVRWQEEEAGDAILRQQDDKTLSDIQGSKAYVTARSFLAVRHREPCIIASAPYLKSIIFITLHQRAAEALKAVNLTICRSPDGQRNQTLSEQAGSIRVKRATISNQPTLVFLLAGSS